jgi:outer membrane immunogenic protein
MKRVIVASLTAAGVFLGFSTAASAADLGVGPAPVYLKAQPPVYNWTGFYIGGNVGYGWGNSSSNLSLSDPAAASANFSLDGIKGGGQIGYNYQIKNWVLGIEADIQAADEHGNTSLICPGGPTGGKTNGACTAGGDTLLGGPVTDNLSEKVNWFGTIRGRVGPTITPTILPYVTGGLAYGGVSATDDVSGTFDVPPGTNHPVSAAASLSTNTVKVGWTAGAGVEGVLGGNWTGKIEYLYMDLGSVSGSFVTPIVAPSGGFLSANYNSHITENIVRVGVNYHFH